MSCTVSTIAALFFAALLPFAAQAQEEPTPLVVCSSTHIEEVLTRLVGSTVRVESMFRNSTEPVRYEQGNERALELLATADLVLVDAHGNPFSRFWVERLREQGVAVDCVVTEEHSGRPGHELCQLYSILVRRFPEKRHVFNGRLNYELWRLHNGDRSASLIHFR